MQNLKLALIQQPLAWEDKAANLNNFESLIASISDVDLIILPEMFTTGFSSNSKLLAEKMDGPSVERMQKWAQGNNAAIGGSLIIEDNKHYFNRFLFVNPNGEITFYDKRHLFRMAGEQHFYTAGNRRVIVNYKDWKINLQICYDLRFPVWTRNKEDYDMMVFVANWPEIRKDAWDSLLKARAIENLAYVVGVNRVGVDGNEIAYSGGSSVYNFDGKNLAYANNHKAEVLKVELSLEALFAYRKKFPAYLDADKFEIH